MQGSDPGRGMRPADKVDTSFMSCSLFKPVSWASVFPRPCTLLIYLRETLIVFSLQYLVFFICDLRNVKRKYRHIMASSVSFIPGSRANHSEIVW